MDTSDTSNPVYLIVAIVVGVIILRVLWRVVTGAIRLVLTLIVLGVVGLFLYNLLLR